MTSLLRSERHDGTPSASSPSSQAPSAADIEQPPHVQQQEEEEPTTNGQTQNDETTSSPISKLKKKLHFPGNNRKDAAAAAAETEQQSSDENNDPPIKLYKSSRLKGYMTLVLASAINYHSANESDNVILANAVPSTTQQQRYAQAVALVSTVLSFITIPLHFDRFTCLKNIWIKAFQPKSKIELALISFLVIWWIVATWIQTSVKGIAGDGKEQYNLYFSTWACCITSIWTLERWCVAYGLPSLKKFMASWPNRAPGWIAIFFLSFADLLCVLDLFLNWDDAANISVQTKIAVGSLFKDVPKSQWQWLLFVCSATIPIAAVFVLAELFRSSHSLPNETEKNAKPEWEIIAEGISLLLLVVGWIPSVIVATIPGGAASHVGNAYFFTWACGVFVMETAVWWVHDWRKGIHLTIQQHEEEYRKIQLELLAKNRAIIVAGAAARNNDDDEEEDESSSNDVDASPGSGETNPDEKVVRFMASREETDQPAALPEAEPEFYDCVGVIPNVIGTNISRDY